MSLELAPSSFSTSFPESKENWMLKIKFLKTEELWSSTGCLQLFSLGQHMYTLDSLHARLSPACQMTYWQPLWYRALQLNICRSLSSCLVSLSLLTLIVASPYLYSWFFFIFCSMPISPTSSSVLQFAVYFPAVLNYLFLPMLTPCLICSLFFISHLDDNCSPFGTILLPDCLQCNWRLFNVLNQWIWTGKDIVATSYDFLLFALSSESPGSH